MTDETPVETLTDAPRPGSVVSEQRWRELTAGMPLGHSGSAHVLLGWCAACPGRDPVQEMSGWRGWAFCHLFDGTVPDAFAGLIPPVIGPSDVPTSTGLSDALALAANLAYEEAVVHGAKRTDAMRTALDRVAPTIRRSGGRETGNRIVRRLREMLAAETTNHARRAAYTCALAAAEAIAGDHP